MINVKAELMQLGRKKIYLQKCIKVNELLSKYESETSVRKRIFEKHIKPIIFCSYAQFNNMLNEVNPQKQIKEINDHIITLKQKKFRHYYDLFILLFAGFSL